MTRREKRFERRKLKRLNKQLAFAKQVDDFKLICDRTRIFDAIDSAKKRVMWKASTQRWSMHQLFMTERLYRDLKAGKDVRRGFSKFYIYERGKRRNISAVKFYERVVQKALCQNVLYPAFVRSLIYDSGASQQGKGTKFAADRMVTALRRYYKRNGNNGYALLIDFKSYFDNINHDVVKAICCKHFKDLRVRKLCFDFIDAYGDMGLGLGSETSQLFAIRYPNRIDHAVTETNSGHKIFYGRYMDDSYIIAKDKITLAKILNKIKYWCNRLKIKLSSKKTKIVAIKNGVLWLKTKYYLTATGKIIRKPCRACITRERRKLKKQLRLCILGRLPYASIEQSFESWAGSHKRRNARLTVWKMRQILKGYNHGKKI